MDGSNSWELLVAACEDLKNATTETFETVAQNYPAFNYCRKYGTTNDLEGELATGWYLPTIAELNTIYQNITIVDASLEKVGGNQFKDSLDSQRHCYLSCCQGYGTNTYVRGFSFDDADMYIYNKDFSENYVCCVRAFSTK